MQRRIIVVFFAIFWVFLSPASATDRGALFKASANGHTMYLFGTIHVGLPEFYPLEPRIRQAVAGASTLAVEVDTAPTGDELSKVMREHAMAAPGFTLPAPLAARVARMLQQRGIEPGTATMFKPWMVTMILTLHDVKEQGYSTALGADNHLADLARAAKVRVLSLESAESQMATFDKLTAAEQLLILDEITTELEAGKLRAELRELVETWSTADRKALDEMGRKADTDTTPFGRFTREVLIDGRNPSMADKLLKLLTQEKNTVAAVGVAHLVGKRSVPALMRARGVTIERIY
jgi:uncharacterized protein YbaP (TraB family)